MISDSVLDKAWIPWCFFAAHEIGLLPKKTMYPPMLFLSNWSFAKLASEKTFQADIGSPPKIKPKDLVPFKYASTLFASKKCVGFGLANC